MAQGGVEDFFGEAPEVLLCAFAEPSCRVCRNWVLKPERFRSSIPVPCATEGLMEFEAR